jgi:hypothetical protein
MRIVSLNVQDLKAAEGTVQTVDLQFIHQLPRKTQWRRWRLIRRAALRAGRRARKVTMALCADAVLRGTRDGITQDVQANDALQHVPGGGSPCPVS